MRSLFLAAYLLSATAGLLMAQEDGAVDRPSTIERITVKGELVWPKTWAVFAPLIEQDKLLPPQVLQSIPDKITVPAHAELPERVIEGRRLEVWPGACANLGKFFEKQAVGNVAYFFLDLESPRDQTVTLGIGGNWWVDVWINGKPVFTTIEGGKRTLTNGNVEKDIAIANHPFTAELRKGRNVLAVRLITGNRALVAVGGPAEFTAALERLTAIERRFALNKIPKKFSNRLVFPVETQAIATAAMDLEFPAPGGNLLAGSLVGLTEMPARQMYYSRQDGGLLDTNERRFDTPVFIRLSKYRYPWEDRHLDAILYTTSPKEGENTVGSVEVLLKKENGEVLLRHKLDKLSPNGLFFSVGFPEVLRGQKGSLEAIWRDGDKVLGKAEKQFLVGAVSDVALSGKVPLRILNNTNAKIANAPMTVGVPFPLGALPDASHVRLVDESGKEMPVADQGDGTLVALWSCQMALV